LHASPNHIGYENFRPTSKGLQQTTQSKNREELYISLDSCACKYYLWNRYNVFLSPIFHRPMKPEERLQIAVMDYLRYKYPKVLSIHVANERHTHPARGAKLKRMGVTAGVPDILVFSPQTSYGMSSIHHGLAIELKVPPNKLTEAQADILAKLIDNGWTAEVCYNFDEAQLLIDGYLKN